MVTIVLGRDVRMPSAAEQKRSLAESIRASAQARLVSGVVDLLYATMAALAPEGWTDGDLRGSLRRIIEEDEAAR